MKIFVTGGSGFIGRHVVELCLERSHSLMLLVWDKEVKDNLFDGRIHYTPGDLGEVEKWQDDMKEFKPEVVLHLGWEGLPDYSAAMCSRNLEYGKNVFHAAARAGCQCLVSTGSCWEYRDRTGALSENAPLETEQAFPAAKNALRQQGEAISKEYGIRFYWPRLFFVYGPGQRKTSIVPHMVHSFLKGKNPEIKNPNNRNDFIYVKDAAAAIVEIMEKKPGKIIYNIGTGNAVSVGTVVSMISQEMNIPLKIDAPVEARPGEEGENFRADIANIRDDLGWVPRCSLSQGIKETIKHIKIKEEKEGR